MLAETSDDMGEIVLVDPTRDALLAVAKDTCKSLNAACYLGFPHEVNGKRYVLVCKVLSSGKYYAEANLSQIIEHKGQSYEDFANEEESTYVFTDSELK